MQFAAVTVITVMAGVAVMAITVMAVATVTVIIDMATNDKPNSYHFCNICIRSIGFWQIPSTFAAPATFKSQILTHFEAEIVDFGKALCFSHFGSPKRARRPKWLPGANEILRGVKMHKSEAFQAGRFSR